MFSQFLKESTKATHAALEKNFVHRIKSIGNKHHYGRFLALIYGYHSVVERSMVPFFSEQNFPDLTTRRNAGFLLEDLEALGEDPPHLFCSVVPKINSYHAALGAAYVFEGSTLGGQVIAGMLSKQLGALEDQRGLKYFLSYKDDTYRMWESFKQTLNAPFNAGEHAVIMASANETFITYKHWIDGHAKD